jgi:hypothetical protein
MVVDLDPASMLPVQEVQIVDITDCLGRNCGSDLR